MFQGKYAHVRGTWYFTSSWRPARVRHPARTVADPISYSVWPAHNSQLTGVNKKIVKQVVLSMKTSQPTDLHSY